MKSATIQSMAKQAKERIKSGYWAKVKNKKLEKIKESKQFDSEMYEIVASIIESEEIVTNPIAKLMNKEYYATLSEEAKTRYVLELSGKYLNMCEIYEKNKRMTRN